MRKLLKNEKTYYNYEFDNLINLNDKNFQKILNFYLLECPTDGKSKRGKTFSKYGFNGSGSFSVLKKELLNSATKSLRKNYKPSKKGELAENFRFVENVVYPNEYCVFLKNDEKTVIQSLFSAIRNSIAHGSFNYKNYKGERYYFFSNFKVYEKARIILKEETLLSWIKIIQNNKKPK